MPDDEQPHASQPGYEPPSSRRATSAGGSPGAGPAAGEPPAAGGPLDAGPQRRAPSAAFRHLGFILYSIGNVVSVIGRLMLFIAVEWEAYERTNSATALGPIGLA